MNTDAHTPLHELARQFPDSLEAAIDDMVDSGFGSLLEEEGASDAKPNPDIELVELGEPE